MVEDGKFFYQVDYNTQNTGFYLNPVGYFKSEETLDILDYMEYSKLGNGYYFRKDLEIVKRK